MDHTSLTLLGRLQGARDEAAWRRFDEIYSPLIAGWLRRHGNVGIADLEDLTQDVLQVVLDQLPRFQHSDRIGAFRCWLRLIAVNRLRGFWRNREPKGTGDSAIQAVLDQLEDSHSHLSRQWDREHDEYIARRVLELIEGEFEPRTWEAFRRTAIDGEATADVADQLGISANAVLIAKSRVLRRLRQETAGLLESI